jgi:hypothetical protein
MIKKIHNVQISIINDELHSWCFGRLLNWSVFNITDTVNLSGIASEFVNRLSLTKNVIKKSLWLIRLLGDIQLRSIKAWKCRISYQRMESYMGIGDLYTRYSWLPFISNKLQGFESYFFLYWFFFNVVGHSISQSMSLLYSQ